MEVLRSIKFGHSFYEFSSSFWAGWQQQPGPYFYFHPTK
jgi:hypothetical protein